MKLRAASALVAIAPSTGHAGSGSPLARTCWRRSVADGLVLVSCHATNVPVPPSLQAATMGMLAVVDRMVEPSGPQPANAAGVRQETASNTPGRVRELGRGMTPPETPKR